MIVIANWKNKEFNVSYQLIIEGDYAYVMNTETKDLQEFDKLYISDLDNEMYAKQVSYNWFETTILPLIRAKVKGETYAI